MLYLLQITCQRVGVLLDTQISVPQFVAHQRPGLQIICPDGASPALMHFYPSFIPLLYGRAHKSGDRFHNVAIPFLTVPDILAKMQRAVFPFVRLANQLALFL